MIGQVIAFLLSPFSIFAWLLGFVGYLAMPVIPKATGTFQGFSRYPVGLAMGMLERAGILVSEHDDIVLKRMSFDDLGVETMRVGSERKEFEDPDGALHSFMGVPFALADEVHGVLFDPRHAALGKRKADDRDRNQHLVPATADEWDEFGISHWYKGVYEFSKSAYELVDLSAVRELVDGGERAEYPQRVEREYEHSRSPFASDMSNLRIILLIVAMVGPFMAIWIGVWQFGKPDSTMSFGLLTLLLSTTGIERIKRVPVAVLLIALPVGIVAGTFVIFSPFIAIGVAVTMLLGWAFVPFLSLAARPSARLADAFSTILWKHGMLGYDRPVFVWTPRQYELVEYATLDETAEVNWYNLDGQTVGFSFQPGTDAWGAELVDADTVEAKRTVADGGTADDSHVPPGYAKAPEIKRANGRYAAFVPKRMRSESFYLDSAIAKARFKDSADGSKSVSRLLWAKENKTENDGTDERRLMFMVMGSAAMSFFTGILVFFVLL